MSPFDQESRRLRRVLGRVDLRQLGDPLAEIGLFEGRQERSKDLRRTKPATRTTSDQLKGTTRSHAARSRR